MIESSLRPLPGSVREDGVPPIHRETLGRIMSQFDECPPDRVQLELVHEQPGRSKLIATPSNAAASAIEVFFYDDDDPRQVAVAGGVDVFLSLPTDIYGKHAQEWRAFLDDFVRGVVQGTLVEKLEYRGERLARSTFTVRLGEAPFTFTRTNVPNCLKGLFKKRTKRTVTYPPYLAE